uniref:Antifreeze protein type IV n=1 Tax=Anabas testudineus TaxID=64144 RepID=A0A7N6AXK4_ANATE
MKFSLIAALVVVLAVAHGSEAASLVKRDVQAEVDRLTKIFNDISAGITSTTHDMVEKMNVLDVTNTTQTYMEDSKAKIQPLVEKVQVEAAKLQEQVKPFVTNIEDQVKPLANMMEKLFQQGLFWLERA